MNYIKNTLSREVLKNPTDHDTSGKVLYKNAVITDGGSYNLLVERAMKNYYVSSTGAIGLSNTSKRACDLSIENSSRSKVDWTGIICLSDIDKTETAYVRKSDIVEVLYKGSAITQADDPGQSSWHGYNGTYVKFTSSSSTSGGVANDTDYKERAVYIKVHIPTTGISVTTSGPDYDHAVYVSIPDETYLSNVGIKSGGSWSAM